MKGSRECKRYVSRFRKELHRMGWDDLYLFKLWRDAKNLRYKPRATQVKEEMRLQSKEF